MLIKERERSGHFVHRGSEEKREIERERLREVRSRNFVTSFAEYNKDKVPMDVATSLVVNHVNLGALYLLCYICVYGYVKHISKKNTYK